MIEIIISNLDVIFGVILATRVAAELIVNKTPTPADDEWVGKIYGLIEKVAGIWGNTAKEFPGEREARKAAALLKNSQ